MDRIRLPTNNKLLNDHKLPQRISETTLRYIVSFSVSHFIIITNKKKVTNISNKQVFAVGVEIFVAVINLCHFINKRLVHLSLLSASLNLKLFQVLIITANPTNKK